MLVCVCVSVCSYMHVYYREEVRDRETERQLNTQGTKGPRGEGWTKPRQRCVRMRDGGTAYACECNFSCGWFGGIIWTESGLSWGQMSQGLLYLPALHAVSCHRAKKTSRLPGICSKEPPSPWFTSNGSIWDALCYFMVQIHFLPCMSGKIKNQ